MIEAIDRFKVYTALSKPKNKGAGDDRARQGFLSAQRVSDAHFVASCFSNPVSGNFKRVVLIPFCLVREKPLCCRTPEIGGGSSFLTRLRVPGLRGPPQVMA
jgi:hypothetical protein